MAVLAMNSQPSVLKRIVLFGLRTFIACGLVLICFEIAVHVHPPTLSWGLAMAGRSSCPPGQALAGTEQRALWHSLQEEILTASKLVKEDGDLELWSTPSGEIWVPAGTGDDLSILLAQQESDIYGAGDDRVGPGDVVLDCGAHVGVYVRNALDAGASKVVAIEPAPLNIECLRRNFPKEIEDGRVVVYPKGVWDKDELLPLYEDPANSAADSFIIRGPNDVVSHHLELTTIDKLAAELELERVDVVKMDIKGAITKALKGGTQTILRDRPLLILATEEKEDDPRAVSRAVAGFDLGYSAACGICAVDTDFTVQPVVMFYR